MTTTLEADKTVPQKRKPRKPDDPKRYGTLIRVTDVFADAIRDGAKAENLTIAEFADAYLLPVCQRRYREYIMKEAKRLGDKS